MYARRDDTLHVIKCGTMLRRRDGKVEDLRIHIDVTGL